MPATAAPPAPAKERAPRDSSKPKAEPKILFQSYFKSVGPRTYAAQVKRAKNRNEYLVLMEGKRDASTGEVRKMRLFIYSEDFVEFFRLIKSAAEFIKAHPLPADVRTKRVKYWAREHRQSQAPPAPTRPAAAVPPMPAPAPAPSFSQPRR